MNTRKNLAYLMLCFFFAIGCSKTDDPVPTKSSEKEITSFKISIQGQEVAAVISASDKKISAVLPIGSDVKAIAPTIVISAKATVIPASGVVQDFSNPIKYIVKAEDGSTNEYTVTVAAAKSTEKKITSFKIPTFSPEAIATISEADKKISLSLPFGSDVKALSPVIVISGLAAITPASGVVQNFSNPVKYTVTAQDGTTSEYTATVTVMPSKCLVTKVNFSQDGVPLETNYVYNTSEQIVQYNSSVTSSGLPVSSNSLTYDANGNLIKDELQIVGIDKSYTSNYSYNDKNQLVGVVWLEKPKNIPVRKLEREYNSSGQIIKDTWYVDEGYPRRLVKYSSITYEYSNTTDANWTRLKHFDRNGVLFAISEYEYDNKKTPEGDSAQNNVTMDVTKNASGVETDRILYTYEYNDIGYPTKIVKTVTSSGSSTPTVSTQTYTYNCK